MARVLPSDVINFIDKATPVDLCISVNDENVSPLSAILDLLAGVPDDLLQVDSAGFTALIAARSQLRSAVDAFRRLTARDRMVRSSYPLTPMAAYGSATPLGVIRSELATCPDHASGIALPITAFLADASLRNTLRIDIASTGAALANDEWKSATVLAGSVIEALLLWAVNERHADVPGTLAALVRLSRRVQNDGKAECS